MRFWVVCVGWGEGVGGGVGGGHVLGVSHRPFPILLALDKTPTKKEYLSKHNGIYKQLFFVIVPLQKGFFTLTK